MSLISDQAAFLLDFCKLVTYATAQGFVVTGGELWRPMEMQAIYVKSGRSKTMNSKHLIRCAVDLNFFYKGTYVCDVAQLKAFGRYWEGLSPKNRWGGNFDGNHAVEDNFKDAPHFERVP